MGCIFTQEDEVIIILYVRFGSQNKLLFFWNLKQRHITLTVNECDCKTLRRQLSLIKGSITNSLDLSPSQVWFGFRHNLSIFLQNAFQQTIDFGYFSHYNILR
jgi:hypothetical protein